MRAEAVQVSGLEDEPFEGGGICQGYYPGTQRLRVTCEWYSQRLRDACQDTSMRGILRPALQCWVISSLQSSVYSSETPASSCHSISSHIIASSHRSSLSHPPWAPDSSSTPLPFRLYPSSKRIPDRCLLYPVVYLSLPLSFCLTHMIYKPPQDVQRGPVIIWRFLPRAIFKRHLFTGVLQKEV